ncbi:hypothetical protein C095_07185 [Fusobacterium necrophorum subsp. funduliforme B35]|uniref:Uncharacterized protein n=1 Tax=Fusobacterium necrophorum subsp. funduliforme B35 TaxID=1226633 RepID=A0A0B4EHP9_9FUSO|nr:hypothetical protein C095_07185 [Fusobacterium necrophorum subsp. funduliforme B35]
MINIKNKIFSMIKYFVCFKNETSKKKNIFMMKKIFFKKNYKKQYKMIYKIHKKTLKKQKHFFIS